MEYPNKLPLELLQSTHPEYTLMLPAYREIDLLASGGYKLKAQIKQFLPRRPGEDLDIYETRLHKFTYSNVLGQAISKQLSKFNNSTVTVSGIEKNQTFWDDFRDDTDLAGRSEKNLISNIFRELLKFKKVYLHVDKPKSEVTPLNKAQEETLGIRPYVTLYSAMQVINWSETKGRPDWVKVYQIVQDTTNPLSPPQTKAIWTFIDAKYVARYEAYVELDSAGNIKNVLEGEDKRGNRDVDVYLNSRVPHNLGTIPVVKVEVPDDLWACDQAASKALEHLRTDCSKYDLLTLAYFQRTYKRVQTPDGDIHATFEGDDEAPPTGLQHVLELEKFEWSEPQGHILAHLRESLSQIENQVRDLVSLGGVSSSLGAVQQSGVSKQLDFYNQETILKSYGQILVDAYQDLLQLVAKSQGITDLVTVSGLDKFELDNLDNLLTNIKELVDTDLSILQAQLPPTAYLILYKKLITLLLGNLSPEQEREIEEEIGGGRREEKGK
ncbi:MULTISPECIES: hypothetical protein [Calothrix]|uniref:Portal protein n=2 Tax=Calothrix TaxID=1186 RepID=A0ABR8A9K0_9CYAN|nr:MULTISPECIES: hypothetical protein [Calothrix]MBD2196606.1 hypothetical protein [Calothrix parietina FACHB-288]MBD2228029.1 hypothetical protein [Calothrix anomala FACHB-343]